MAAMAHRPTETRVVVDFLDQVEWMMEIEETFGVSISDEQLAGVRTIADVKRLVASLVSPSPGVPEPEPACATQRAFYEIRRSVCNAAGVPRSAIRPGTRWKDLPEPWRRQMDWPVRPEIVVANPGESVWGLWAVTAAYLAIFAVIILQSGLRFPEAEIVLGVFGIATVTVVAALSWLDRPRPREGTIGDEARRFSPEQPRMEPSGRRTWSAEQVSRIVDRLTKKILDAGGIPDDAVLLLK
jgi:hypothetical protein